MPGLDPILVSNPALVPGSDLGYFPSGGPSSSSSSSCTAEAALKQSSKEKKEREDHDQATKIVGEKKALTVAELAKASADKKKKEEDALLEVVSKRKRKVSHFAKPAPTESGMSRVQYLSGSSWEGVAMTMNFRLFSFLLKSVFQIDYWMDVLKYNQLLQNNPEATYDPKNQADLDNPEKKLYEPKVNDEGKLVPDLEKPIDTTTEEGRKNITSIVIMVNGYMPPVRCAYNCWSDLLAPGAHLEQLKQNLKLIAHIFSPVTLSDGGYMYGSWNRGFAHYIGEQLGADYEKIIQGEMADALDALFAAPKKKKDEKNDDLDEDADEEHDAKDNLGAIQRLNAIRPTPPRPS